MFCSIFYIASFAMKRRRSCAGLVFFAIFIFIFVSRFGSGRNTEDSWLKPRTNYLEDKNVINQFEHHTGLKFDQLDVKAVSSTMELTDIANNIALQTTTLSAPQRTQSIVGDKKQVNGSNCKLKEIRLSNVSLTVTGLVSFPGSGNTWTRHLIQQMTGLGTSSVYCDKRLENGGFPFDCNKKFDRAVVIKHHRYASRLKKVILLVRNPYDAILAMFNRKGGHTGLPSKEKIAEEVAANFEKNLNRYVWLINETTDKSKGPIYVLQYEKLKTDMANELRKLAVFLNVSVSNRDIHCTVKLQEGNFHRHTDEGEHMELLRSVFDEDKASQIREAVRASEKILKNALNKEFDLGAPVEKVLFQQTK